MAVTVTHSTPADGTFSAAGTAAWNDDHAIADLSAVSKLVGSGAGSAAVGEITLGTALSMSGNTLNATGQPGPVYPGNVPLTGCSYPQIIGSNLSTGNNDLYTVPSGKRLAIYGSNLYNTSIGNIVWYMTAKISGTYYRLVTNSTASTGAVSAGGAVTFILEAGEILSVNTATNNGANVNVRAVLFDDSIPIYSSRLLALAVGDNTVYTVPSGKSAILINALMGIDQGNSNSFFYVNSSGGARTIYWHVVPTGQAVGSGYQMTASASVNDATRSTLQGTVSLTDGDFVNINTDANTATQIAWVNVMETA